MQNVISVRGCAFGVLAAILVAVATANPAQAQTAAPAAIVQRTTLIVSDIEKSMAFYERLGLVKTADRASTGPSDVFGMDVLPLTADPTRSHLVVMSGDRGASIGLLWYDRPPLASARGNLMGLGTGDIILAIQVRDLQAAYNDLDRLGVRFHRAPARFVSPDLQPGMRMYAYDPDGHMVEVSQVGGPSAR